MTDAAELLRTRLAALHPEVLEIRDDSHEHRGHAEARGGGHFSVLIVSDAFTGQNRLSRHQQVYRMVGDLVPHPVHALSIKALTPEEFPS